MKRHLSWIAVALVAFAAGGAAWWAGRPAPLVGAPSIGPAALYAVAFRDLDGKPQALGQFQGRPVVLNFWATWCAPCREEMPAFDRLARRWGGKVAFVGVSQEPAETIRRFQQEVRIGYALWAGGEETAELARRLGNRVDGLPFTVVLGSAGNVAAAKVGPYTEAELNRILGETGANGS